MRGVGGRGEYDSCRPAWRLDGWRTWRLLRMLPARLIDACTSGTDDGNFAVAFSWMRWTTSDLAAWRLQTAWRGGLLGSMAVLDWWSMPLAPTVGLISLGSSILGAFFRPCFVELGDSGAQFSRIRDFFSDAVSRRDRV